MLRVIQEREVRSVGSNCPRPVDVRIVAATHRDLVANVAAGTFRQDLFYRLNVVVILVPPLRDRREDIPMLADHFLRKHAARHGRDVGQLSAGAIGLLTARDWPGNVRELENVIERAVVLSRGTIITETDFAHLVGGIPAPSTSQAGLASVPLARAKHDFERDYLARLLVEANGNFADAARIAGLDRSNLRRLLKRFEIEAEGEKD